MSDVSTEPEQLGGRRSCRITISNSVMSASELTAALGREADQTVNTGDAVGRWRKHVAERSSWTVRSHLEPEIHVEFQLEDLLERSRDAMVLARDLPGDTECVLIIHHIMNPHEGQGHGIHFSSEWLQLLALLNAEIDIDQYIYDEEWFAEPRGPM
jgi:hypothetical protein